MIHPDEIPMGNHQLRRGAGRSPRGRTGTDQEGSGHARQAR